MLDLLVMQRCRKIFNLFKTLVEFFLIIYKKKKLINYRDLPKYIYQ